MTTSDALLFAIGGFISCGVLVAAFTLIVIALMVYGKPARIVYLDSHTRTTQSLNGHRRNLTVQCFPNEVDARVRDLESAGYDLVTITPNPLLQELRDIRFRFRGD